VLERDSSFYLKDAAAATDLMRRRILLPHSFHFVLSKFAVCIATDSTAVGEALHRLGIPSGEGSRVTNAKWEIAVETQCEAGAPLFAELEIDPIEVHHFGASYAIRMGSGSWFAQTPPSLNGVGFAMVTGNERDQIDQLAVYLRAIISFFDDGGLRLKNGDERSIPDLTLEVCG
jgi:hypothetical protein